MKIISRYRGRIVNLKQTIESNYELLVFSGAQRKEIRTISLLALRGEKERNKTMDINQLSSKIIGAAIELHKTLGPGLLESAYQKCLSHELRLRGISLEDQKPLPLIYKGEKLDCGYQMDLVVENAIIVELKSCEKLKPIHKAQLLTYLKLSGFKLGLLLNFNVPLMRDGIVRVVNEFEE